MSLTSNQFVFSQQLSREPKIIKPKTTLIDTNRGYIYLKLGQMNLFGAFYVY